MTRRLVRFPVRGYWPPHEWPKPPWNIPEGLEKELGPLIPDPQERPPCKLMKVSFEQLRIGEIHSDLEGWMGDWQQRLMIAEDDGATAQTVAVPVPQFNPVPFEMPLNYTKYVSVQRTDPFNILTAMGYGIGLYRSFRVATAGSLEVGLPPGSLELPSAENIHGGQDGWMMGDNVLAASGPLFSYEVSYNVSCSPVIVTELPHGQAVKIVSAAVALPSKTEREAGPELIRLAFARLGYIVTDDYGDGEERMLQIVGPGRIEDIEKAFKDGKK